MTRNHRRSLASIALIGVMLSASTASAALAQTEVTKATTCRAEIEPNDSLAEAVTLEAERCVSGTLIEVDDEDVFVWKVDSEAAASSWSFALTGESGLATSASVVRVETDSETGAPGLGAEVGRLAFESGDPAEPAMADLSLEAGDYAIILQQPGTADADAPQEDIDYELRWSPADTSGTGAAMGQARIIVGTADEPAPMVGDGVAVELLLDTSGSMLTRLGQGTKLEAAKQSLISLVRDLPAGLPVALRTFKDKPKSCATVLRVPVGPLKPKAMASTIREMPARKGTRTPIAKALTKVPQDLRGVDGHRVVVLVTDGKEDCGGDPAAAIAALADAGYTSTVHIIGYTVDDPDVEGTLAGWAASGGGRYFDAPDPASLDAALATALTVPYLVFDADGTMVAQGLAGDEGVELDAGSYRVEVLTDPAANNAVVLEAGAVVEVPLAAADEVAG
jgi:hypothetical protein